MAYQRGRGNRGGQRRNRFSNPQYDNSHTSWNEERATQPQMIDNPNNQKRSEPQITSVDINSPDLWGESQMTVGEDLCSNVNSMTIHNSNTSRHYRDSEGWQSRRGRGRGYRGGQTGAGDESGNQSWQGREQQRAEPKAEGTLFLSGAAAQKWQEERRAEQHRLYANVDYKELCRVADEAETERWSKYPRIEKMIYEEHPNVAEMTPAEAEHFRETSNGIKVQLPAGAQNNAGDTLHVPNPIAKLEYAFSNFPGLRALLLQTGFEKPSPIQAQAWPLIMQGRDVVGIAQTGTGKTLAFLLPAYAHILRQPPQKRIPGAHVLIMAPTRELALQIHAEVLKFNCADLSSVVIYGGVDRKQQIREVERGCNVLIATPGRLDDLICAGHIDITSVTYVVLDEADRMLDAGFEAVIRKTMYKIRPDRQTIMTSATWPEGVQRLANSYMQDPVQVIIGTLDLAAVATIEQTFVFLDDKDFDVKYNCLLDLIEAYDIIPDAKVMVFVSTKARAAYIATELAMKDIACVSMHGNMEQSEREMSIQMIKNGEVKYLIATDVASRGIDIPNLTHVVNLDFPRDIEDYVHRIGRTGRAGKSGQSVSFFTYEDSRHAKELKKILEKAGQEVPRDLIRLIDKHEKYMERRGNDRPQRRSRYDYGNSIGF